MLYSFRPRTANTGQFDPLGTELVGWAREARLLRRYVAFMACALELSSLNSDWRSITVLPVVHLSRPSLWWLCSTQWRLPSKSPHWLSARYLRGQWQPSDFRWIWIWRKQLTFFDQMSVGNAVFVKEELKVIKQKFIVIVHWVHWI